MANTVAGAEQSAHMPSDVSTSDLGFFDKFATVASRFASRAWFFALCVLLVLVWVPSYFVIKSVDTWQLIINTATTIVTFLLVALLQNSQTRADEAVQDKLNAVAGGLAALMEHSGGGSDGLGDATRELRKAVGLEDHESSD
ncbi:low affinity iron permease family protein [Kribbella hippodromi]|uniref:Low affinity iron permease family protein n=1 Tax=Kribbella hippodromi TaxID=434347 RepID=A0ABP4Q136_9ACTN